MTGARDYVAWSLLAAGLFAAVCRVVAIVARNFGASDALSAARGRRLQRRLDRRLARGDDNYFEELRSIEVAIAQHQAEAAPTTLQRFKLAHDALVVMYVLWFGFVLVKWFGHALIGIDAPAWTQQLGVWWMPILGLQQIILSLQPDAEGVLSSRFFGACLFLVSAAIIGIDLVPGGHLT